MHIKSIDISGFKSYGNRTEIKGFDPLFNAITGLNGSGKSNILDSICFVLGISNLSQVRASNLQELVYKNGQAGISKATVSITFDNSDPNSSPLGYENHREITVTRTVVIGGRNKYLINGTIAHNHRVQDFFQSVQLNVNNPHFLIMQGRITKVLNMKPMEILSMVEEAAGTRMYEVKKENSLKLITKKEMKLEEIEKLLSEEITPLLEKLKEERRDYCEYSKIVRDFEHLSKLHTAWKFMQAQEHFKISKENAKKITGDVENTKKGVQESKAKIEALSKSIGELEKKKDQEVGGKLRELEEDLKQKQMVETKSNNALQNLKAALNDENKKMKQMAKSLNEDRSSLQQRQKHITNLLKKVENLKATCQADKEAVIEAEKCVHEVNAGMVKDMQGKAATIASQMMDAEQEIKRCETDEKVSSMALTSLKQELSKKQATYTDMDDAYKSNKASFQKLEKETKKLKEEIDRLNYDENTHLKTQQERQQLEQDIQRLRRQCEVMASRLPQLRFDYVNPGGDFQQSKVYGLVSKLFTLNDKKTALALELTAGGKLHNVVVQDDKTCTALLKRGQLKRRTTFIPLDQIRSSVLDRKVVDRAESLVGGDKVHTALSLISYDPRFRPAMQYVFSKTFICKDMGSANVVAFDWKIMTKCVTLDGEIFNPAGTLSGGSMNNRTKFLVELMEMKEGEQVLKSKVKNYETVKQECARLESLGERYQRLMENYEMKKSELNMLKATLENSNYHVHLQDIERIKKSIEEKTDIITKCKESKKQAEKRLKELKQMDSKSARQQELKNAEKNLTDKQKKLAISEKSYKDTQDELELTQLETEELTKSIESSQEQLESFSVAIQAREGDIAKVSEEHTEKKKTVEDLLEQVKSQKALLKGHSAEIGKLYKEKETLTRDVENAQLHLQQLEHDVAKNKTDITDAETVVNRFLNAYDWIQEEKKYFGVPNTEYDFTNYDVKATSARLTKLEESKNKLAKSVNMRAQNMLANAEQEYKDLVDKREVVLKDKQQIEKVIKELDEKKRVSLKAACVKVNIDFGSIYSTLLPGAKAKLVPQENKNVLEGLEFKVGFGDVWKEALTELSGGQRSLVALSLILALLLFKPAPIYILDEVDAALDLSHTQNIGEMLKKHFKKSQFIVVSLKDGMFTNANVLFKTKFVDGMSTVTRISQKGN